MIYVFLADGFEEVEAVTPIDLLRRAGLDVVTAAVSDRDDNTITGSHGIQCVCDIHIRDAVYDGLEGVILPGGKAGTANLTASDKVAEFVRFTDANGLVTAAICAAPSVIGGLGLLEGKRAVCYPGWEDKLTGAEICDIPAVTDGNTITARGAGASLEFSYELIRKFCGEAKADEIARSIVWSR
ncbi:MAG: DJ-1/PfpI family protein [Oscillospiraceae bacterium]|nr:DJ-1/PfpI family protein [Oscillospiraceae bacterium]